MNPRSAARRVVLGISLIEALVALAVMAFGMLGVVGMLSTLRFNADLSRQRAEAVRLAQDAMESWRAYSVLRSASAVAPQIAFEDIVDTGPDMLLVAEVNTPFSRETIVVPEAASSPRVREVRVLVRWQDRRGEPQEVLLTSQIGYVPPELAAVVAQRADRGPVGRPGNRHPLIPRAAVAVPGEPGSSRFDPPGGAGLGWVFNNDTGLIVATCPPPPATACTLANRLLVAGSLSFALGSPPSRAAAEAPSDPMPSGMQVAVVVRYTQPSPGGMETCIVAESPDRRRVFYYCAMPISSTGDWTGTVDPFITQAGVDVRASDVYSPPTAPLDTSAPTDMRSTRFRICRYTPDSVNRREVEVPAGMSLVTASWLHNSRHPWRYSRAMEPYSDRNFLVVPAGDGASLVYGCPTEDPLTAIQSNSHHHPRVVP
jgi:hypothetical protein